MTPLSKGATLTLAVLVSWMFVLAVGLLVFEGVKLALPAPALPSAHVKVLIDSGHGSGVHIGGGFYLTAAHVVSSAKDVVLENELGKKRQGHVLWSSSEYDLALVKLPDTGWTTAVPLVCDGTDAALGTEIIAHGNPMALNFLSSVGRVAGAVAPTGRLPAGLPVNVAVAPGMSGGAVVDANSGSLVGLSVAMMQTGAGVVGFALVVPRSAICNLLGRTV